MYDLESVLRVSKQSLKNKIDNNWFDEHRDRGFAMLARRGRLYNLDDLEYLAGFIASSHDECVVENSYDYTPVELYQSERNMKLMDKAFDRVANLKAIERKAMSTYGA